MYTFKINSHGHNLNKNYRGYYINMIVLNRENIINGLDKFDGIKRIVSNTNYNPYEVLLIKFMED